MNVAAVLMQVLRSAGVRYLFGNPGTTELPFLDALADSGLEYVLGLQEATAVAAADGYAQAAGTIGVVNVHVAPGLANGLSILHSAARAKTPLLVTAGQQDTRFLMDAPILAADLVRMAEQFTKWAYEIRRAEEAPQALRRAVKVALTPPTGPVFLSLPMDLMRGVVEDAAEGPPPMATRTRPEPAAVQSAARLLAGARASSPGSFPRRACRSDEASQSCRWTTTHGRSGGATPSPSASSPTRARLSPSSPARSRRAWARRSARRRASGWRRSARGGRRSLRARAPRRRPRPRGRRSARLTSCTRSRRSCPRTP